MKRYRLIGRDGQEYVSAAPGLIGGNTDGLYGRLDCRAALRALGSGDRYRKKRLFFADEATAVAAGYRPCGACMPDASRQWRDAKRRGS